MSYTMNEREAEGLREIFEVILIRHVGEDKKAVAAMLIDLVVKVYEDSEGGIVQ